MPCRVRAQFSGVSRVRVYRRLDDGGWTGGRVKRAESGSGRNREREKERVRVNPGDAVATTYRVRRVSRAYVPDTREFPE